MGCISTKERAGLDPTAKKHMLNGQLSQADKERASKARIIDAIKRKDLILFEKTIQQYEMRPTEVIGPITQQKTLLHHLAQSNFTEGMSLTLEYIVQFHMDDASKILNYRDVGGNTPLITCCLANSAETLEVLLKYDQFIDVMAKNLNGKTAMEIALDNTDSPCATILQGGTIAHTRSNSSSTRASASTNATPASNIGSKTVMSGKDEDFNPKNTRGGASNLKSVINMTKDKSYFNETTRLYPVLKKLEESNTNFVDEDFPHDLYSMVPHNMIQEMTEKYNMLKWERPTKFMNSDFNMVKLFEGIELNNVADSPLAGCDIYSALAAMTEYPSRLLKVFVAKEANKYGAYSVNFMISGIPVEILLDDYFPYVENSHLLFSKPKGNEIWFLLLEKAFAKLYGNYIEAQSVDIAEVFEMMTGMPSSQLPLRDGNEETLWKALMDFDRKNYIVCAGKTKNEDTKNRIFTIMGLYEVDQMRIVKLRNHFEDFEWKGSLSPNSDKWTNQLKEEVGHYKGEKGCFYMEVKEFTSTFDFLSVCHYHDNWVRNALEVTVEPGKSTFFELVVDKEMDAFISVHQKLPRFVNEAAEYDISPVEIVIAEKLSNDELRAVDFGEKDSLLGKHTVYATDKIKTKLAPGKYVVRVKVRWVDEMPHEFTINAFSPSRIDIKEVAKQTYPDFLQKVYVDASRNVSDKFDLSNKCKFSSAWAGPHLWLCADNKGDKVWKLDIIFEKMVNLKLCKKHMTDENTLTLVVGPGEKVVTYVKRRNGGTVELSWRFQQSWE